MALEPREFNSHIPLTDSLVTLIAMTGEGVTYASTPEDKLDLLLDAPHSDFYVVWPGRTHRSDVFRIDRKAAVKTLARVVA